MQVGRWIWHSVSNLSSLAFPARPASSSSLAHSSSTQGTLVAWRNMRIIMRLQAGTARRTPTENVPLKKRQKHQGKGPLVSTQT
ncbi:uncharacterized protein BDW47DRAFT_101303 [Aspergillus candidus]|uniref:Uncharacterized protein n=1 Tax=Aspergillus candidus TaxID=41067 RepID=A0A2I2FIU5_ASPCN|nr:hypothetical protein BDW47DRAFT_101303 [Aspergillus candidus]PLB40543.1 hypothetical protein BDW47DRAFT_101303 [Aspergillus candidus]